MQDWLDDVIAELAIPHDALATEAILDLARAAAHGVQRPAAPLTTFLVGYALGATGAHRDEVIALCRRVAERADARGGAS